VHKRLIYSDASVDFSQKSMRGPLQPPDSHHLRAAQGWLELGTPEEALKEVEQIISSAQAHPEVLNLRWEVLAAEKKWEPALEVATKLIGSDSEDPAGWVHRSYCLHELKRTLEARDNLLGVVDKFPLSATIRYNLACYECQLGDLAKARQWLEKAFRLGKRSHMRLAALKDHDLQPLWPEIRSG
jgi:tetratricopeptide (TPR) repeat protein